MQTANRVKLTKSFVANVLPGKKRTVDYDTQFPKFGLILQPT